LSGPLRISRWLSCVVLFVPLSACTSLQWFSNDTAEPRPTRQATGEHSELFRYLSENHTAVTGRFASSPWGTDVELRAGSTYFAATGESCRSLSVDAVTGSQRLIACLQADGSWLTRREVTAR